MSGPRTSTPAGGPPTSLLVLAPAPASGGSGLAIVMVVDKIVELADRAARTIEAARADVNRTPNPRVTFIVDTTDWDRHVDQALTAAESTPDLRRIK